MAKLLRDDRKVVRKGEKLLFRLIQEQEYEGGMDKQLITSWQKELHDKNKWLSDFEAHKKLACEKAVEELTHMKTQIETDIKNIEDGMKIWTNITENYEDLQPLK